MNLAAPFIARPVGTTLLTIAIALAGLFAYLQLPVAPLPQVDFPTILVQAMLPGASPDTMATAVAEPLERHLGQIANVTEMTSQSSLGQSRIVLQFSLDRDIDGAARDVEAAINAAHADLPTSMRQNPIYRKVNPADAPILVLSLTSKTRTRGQVYDAAASVLQQRISQLEGVGEVDVNGSALPAVRVELNPNALARYGVGLEDVRAALASANANTPKGVIEADNKRYQIYTNDQALHAADYRPLIVGYRNDAPVRLVDIADVLDSVQDVRNAGIANGEPAVLLIVYRQPGANMIATVDRVRAALPQLRAAIPADVDIRIGIDRSTTVRSSLRDTQVSLILATCLVILVVFLFLRNARAALIPSVAVPISIIGTFGVMYLLGYSIDNLSLMALTVATGFVVDDAIVVLENVSRHIEAGVPRLRAAMLGAREVSFTVLSMSASLVAVFLPILLMGGIVGRVFREFALTLSIAVGVSLVISLTATPMMCAILLRPDRGARESFIARVVGRGFDTMHRFYARSLGWALRHPRLVILSLLSTIALNFQLYTVVPKGFFPQQDTGRMVGGIQADQAISFQSMRQKLAQFVDIVQHDPAVATANGFTGGRQTNSGFVFVALKPLSERHVSVDRVIARLRGQLQQVSGARLFLQAVQDFSAGGRQTNAQYQFTLQGPDEAALYDWARRLATALQSEPTLVDVNSDQQQHGLETRLDIDRATAARLGLVTSTLDNTLYDAFGQRQVSTIYNALNQYFVIMEVAPKYWQSPKMLEQFYVSTSGAYANGTQLTNAVPGTVTGPAGGAAFTPLFSPGSTPTSYSATATAAAIALSSARNNFNNSIANTGHSLGSSGAAVSTAAETIVPFAAFTEVKAGNTPLVINHQNQFVATTISFNLPPGQAIGLAVDTIRKTMQRIGMPSTIHGSFTGTARYFTDSLRNEPVLIAAALVAVYIVLGLLYESYVHPITILSTLPSAGVGAVLALMLAGQELSIISLIGVLLLIGIVKKNAILMIDFALAAERTEGLDPRSAIERACVMRFRPIMMTSFAALLGALPLAFGGGEGAEIRHPLGISIIGGLLVSQILTLYTTPVVYLYLDRLRLWAQRLWWRIMPSAGLPEAGE